MSGTDFDRRRFANQAADDFRTNVLARIDLVLDDHLTGVAQFALEFQRRLDEAEDLLQAIAESRQGKSKASRILMTAELSQRIDAHVRTIKARST